MQIDDIVMYKVGDGREELAVILLVHSNGSYSIEFINNSLVPRIMVVPGYKLTPFAMKNYTSDVCECGLKGQKVPGRSHFRFCPKFKND